MSELNFTGNAVKGSRAIVSFDKSFDLVPAAAVIKELLQSTFSVPRGSRKSKPFIDRVVSFTYADNKVWMRHYEIQPITSSEEARVVSSLEAAAKRGLARDEPVEEEEAPADNDHSLDGVELIEIGPRFVMTPTVILEGSFSGPKVYENKEFVSADSVRAEIREKRAARKGGRDMVRTKRNVVRIGAEREHMIAQQVDINDDLLFACE